MLRPSTVRAIIDSRLQRMNLAGSGVGNNNLYPCVPPPVHLFSSEALCSMRRRLVREVSNIEVVILTFRSLGQNRSEVGPQKTWRKTGLSHCNALSDYITEII